MSASISQRHRRWIIPLLRPYRRGLAALAALATAEIVLRIVAPFAMLVVVDHALGTAPLGPRLADVADARPTAYDPDQRTRRTGRRR